MICHFGHGGPFKTNGTEGINGGLQLDLLRVAGAKSPINSSELLAKTCTYIVSKSEEQRHVLQTSLGSSSSLRKMPGIEPWQVQKMKKLHTFVLYLITPVGFEQHWRTQIAKLMENGKSENPNISVYDLLCRYQREREKFVELDMALLWDRIKDDQREP